VTAAPSVRRYRVLRSLPGERGIPSTYLATIYALSAEAAVEVGAMWNGVSTIGCYAVEVDEDDRLVQRDWSAEVAS